MINVLTVGNWALLQELVFRGIEERGRRGCGEGKREEDEKRMMQRVSRVRQRLKPLIFPEICNVCLNI